jgi:two-component system cell cycle sensor histidine kinase/response regulator CckA
MNSSSLAQITQVLDKVATAKLLVDQQGRLHYANPPAVKTFMLQAAELHSLQVQELIAAPKRDHFLNAFLTFTAGTASDPLTLAGDLAGLRSNGKPFPMELIVNRLYTAEGAIYLLTVSDTTERMQSHRRFKLAFEQSTVGVMISNEAGLILMANPAFLAMFRYEEDELLGQPVEILMPLTVRHAHGNYRRDYMQEPSIRRMGAGRELYGLRRNGVKFPVEVSLAPLQGGDETEILVTVVDVTERRKIEDDRQRLEAKIRQTQKLESLGILTGGIAQDFNNILTDIVGNAELAQMDLPVGSSIRRYLDGILRASHRAAELCAQMLAYSGGGKRLHESFDLNELIESTRDLIHTSLAKNASLAVNLARDLPKVNGDATQIRQVVMNLIINASEALKDNQGIITVSTGVIDFQPGQSSPTNPLDEQAAAGRYIYFLVNDNGIGMTREVQEKIFDPFFTTKFTGRGLGLAAVLGIINSHGGAIRIYSEPGVGTSIRVLLPHQGPDGVVEEETTTTPGEGGTVLVIDDEQVVQQTTSDTLRRLGYAVLNASDGLEGLELFKSHHEQITLVLLDLTMPNLGDEETYTHLRKIDSEKPVVIMSGFSEQDILQKFVGRGIAAFLQKPISPARLMTVVKEVMDAYESRSR